MSRAKKTVNYILDFSAGMGRRKITTFAGSGAYFLFMSLVPMIMLLCSVLQYTPLTEDMVLDAVSFYVPYSMYEVVERIVSTVYAGGNLALTVSIVLTLWSASASMKALMRGMDAVYDAERRESYLGFSIRACVYMLIFIAMLLVSLVSLVYGKRIMGLAQTYLPSGHTLTYVLSLLRYLRYLVVTAMLAVVFTLLYRWMPAVSLRYRHQWPGAAFASVAWVVFSWVFSLYVDLSGKFGAYGFLGTILVAMIWMYFCLYFLLIGGYINRYLDLLRSVRRGRESAGDGA